MTLPETSPLSTNPLQTARPDGRAEGPAVTGVLVCDPEGIVVYLDQTQATYLGQDALDGVIGRHLRTLHPPEQFEALEGSVRPALARDGHWSGTLPMLRRDGGVTVLQAEVEQRSNGYRYYCCREQGREREPSSIVTEGAHIFRTVLDQVPLPVTIKDASLRITFMNQCALQALGVTLDQVVNRRAEEFNLELAAEKDPNDRQVLQSGNALICDTALPLGGEKRHYHTYYARIEDASGYRVASVCADITSDRKLQQQSEKMLAEQQKLMLMQREFISMVSHEFRTPLATMQGVLYLMRNPQDENADKRRRWIGLLGDAVTTLRQIADRVLELNRLDGAMRPAPAAALALAPFLREFTANLGDLHGHTRVIVEINPQVPATVRVNVSLLRTVLDHLTANALKYSPPGSTVRLRVESHDGCPRINLVDSGPGINPSDLQHLWEPFFRADQSQLKSGIGLGLTIARRAAELIGATVGVESTPGAGSTFWVQLPAAEQ